jgi:tetratricopeptide (TPR) repeat protein
VLHLLGQIDWVEGDVARAAEVLDESLRRLRESGSIGEVARDLATIGHLARAQGEIERAEACYAESLALRREIGDSWGIATLLAGLGAVALARGDDTRAARLHGQALALRRAHDDRGGISLSLDGLAAVAAARPQPERAARLFGAAAAQRAALGMPVPLLPTFTIEVERGIAGVRRRLGEAAFAAAWAAGQALTPEAAVEDALTLVEPAPPAAPVTMVGGDGGSLVVLTRSRRDAELQPLPVARCVCNDDVDQAVGGAGANGLATAPVTDGSAAEAIRFDREARELIVAGRRAALTPLEFGVLHYLTEREGRAVTRMALLSDVWGYEYEGGSNVVDAAVRSLRKKLGRYATAIETVTKVGYRYRRP